MNSLARTIVIVVLILLLIGSLPTWGYAHWGYYPAGGLGTVLLVMVILLLIGKL